MQKNIVVIKGDGIGPEIITEAMKVMSRTAQKYGIHLSLTRWTRADAPSTNTRESAGVEH